MDDPSEDAIRVHVLRIGDPFYKLSELTLTEFAIGIAQGKLSYMQRERWMWREPSQ